MKKAPQVTRSDGRPGLPLPNPRRIHRVAVAAGGHRQVQVESRDFGKGFVHVFDESSLSAVIAECDTVTDFVEYLAAKEELYGSAVQIEFDGGEEDLLAVYFHRGRKFPPDLKGEGRLRGTLWQEFTSKDEYHRKKQEDRTSYAWDRIVDHFAAETLADRLEFGSSLSEVETALRVMAKENRFARRVLGKSYLEFIKQSTEIESRMTISPSGVTYVFLAKPHGTNREFRQAELGNRCFVARGEHDGQSKVVIGIGTERYDPERPGFSLDLCYLRIENLTAEQRAHAKAIKQEFGYFAAPRVTRVGGDEYPQP